MNCAEAFMQEHPAEDLACTVATVKVEVIRGGEGVTTDAALAEEVSGVISAAAGADGLSADEAGGRYESRRR